MGDWRPTELLEEKTRAGFFGVGRFGVCVGCGGGRRENFYDGVAGRDFYERSDVVGVEILDGVAEFGAEGGEGDGAEVAAGFGVGIDGLFAGEGGEVFAVF